MTGRKFLSDQHARIPFSVIGIFLLLGSSVTSVYISRLELEKSREITSSLEVNAIEDLLYCFESDLSNALNLAGLKAVKEVGKHPVIISSLGTNEQMNLLRMKAIIKEELNVYLTGHFLENMFSNGQYSINIVLQNDTVIRSIENITLEPLVMQLQRYSIPLIGPNQTQNYSTYFVVSVPLRIEIRQLKGYDWHPLTTRTIVVSSILTSRYPLLECLMKEYQSSINGSFSSLWTFTTVASNIYSLLRGFKHYRTGRPLNIVDNRHLSLILNSGLLLEQGLLFGSVDPLGLVDLAREVHQTLRHPASERLGIFNEEMEGEGYSVEPENLSQGSANADAGAPVNETISISPSINLSEISERILYTITSVTFHFENDEGDTHDETIPFDDAAQSRITELVQQQANQSFHLTSVTKHLERNITTQNQLLTIISDIYQDTIATTVHDRVAIFELSGDPGDGWMDGGTTPWALTGFQPISSQVLLPEKGFVIPGCPVSENTYNVSYQRNHTYWMMVDQVINGSIQQIKVWNNQSDQLIERVVLQMILRHWASYQDTKDDIVDVMYQNESLDDLNLADTVETYQSFYNDSDSEKQELITTRNNTGMIGLVANISGTPASWALEESWCRLEEIHESIRHITLDSSITAKQYPSPLQLLDAAKNDLLLKFIQNISGYVDYHQYHPDAQFLSMGKKAVYFIRDWFTKKTQNMTEDLFSEISRQMMRSLESAIPSSVGFTTQNITEVIEDTTDAIRNQFTIPFGYDLSLTRYNPPGVQAWNETIRLAVNHIPHYLDPFQETFEGSEELWTMKIRNRCIFGPTGLPLLPPSPITVWILTMNLWIIDVQGEYLQFRIIDTSDETIFNPLLGHEPQTYVRESKIISAGNVTLGQNTRLSFNFTTVAFGLVPPWGMMLGDIQEDWFDEHTPGFDEGKDP